MKFFFDQDNPLVYCLNRFCDFMYLNVLCLLCCIPLITIGPSFSALYYCMLKISRSRDSSMTRMFFHSFKTNLKQGIVLTLLFAVIASVLLANLYLCFNLEGAQFKLVRNILFLVFAVFVCIVSYTFPFLAQFDNSITNILKYSLLMAVSNLGYTVIIVLLNSIPFVLFLFFPAWFLYTSPGWLLFGFALTAFLNSKLFVRIFNKHIPEGHEF